MGQLLDSSDLARRLQVSPRTVEKWRAEGRGPRYVRVGRGVRYDEADVLAWVDDQKRGGEGIRAAG